MMKKPSAAKLRIQQQILEIRAQLANFDLVCPGHLLKRTKVCGKPTCRCATSPEYRHGPYYEWTRWENGRLVHTTLPPHQAKEVERAIKNHRAVARLLADWSRESEKLIRSLEPTSPDNIDT